MTVVLLLCDGCSIVVRRLFYCCVTIVTQVGLTENEPLLGLLFIPNVRKIVRFVLLSPLIPLSLHRQSAVADQAAANIYMTMNELKKAFAAKLLNIKAIKLQPENPFTWASGWKSPFYCDNRKTLSYPALRSFVKLELAHAVLEHFPEATAVAGVATGAIAQGALVADELNLPFCYVRSKPKDHGMQNLIEGTLPQGAKVVVVEDLISTGGSSLKAVDALRKAGFEVVGMVASYTYGFPIAEQAFREAGVRLVTLTDYEHVVAQARETGYIKEEDVEVLHAWRKDPAIWKK